MLVALDTPAPIVSPELAKAHLRVEGNHENEYIAALCQAASGWLDGPEGVLRFPVMTQQLEWRTPRLAAGHHCLRLSFGPPTAIAAIEYRDSAGVTQTVAADSYVWSPTDGLITPLVAWVAGTECRVRYTAGSDTPPPAVVQAALLLIGHWFRNRAAVSDGRLSVTAVPLGVEALIRPLRRVRI